MLEPCQLNRLALFLPIILFLVLSVILLLGLDKDPTDLPSALVGKSFPAFNLPSLDSENGFLDQQDIVGEAALVNVWATWCYACRIEHGMLNELATSGVKIIGLNYKDNQKDAKRWLELRGDPYAFSVFDAQGSLGIDLGVYGAPETFLVDANGVIRFRRVGVIDERVWASEFKPLYDQLKATSE
jgi:cytochrome c biogenesis protein CcmG/thiol:disulfide interchange protein DsbE